MPSAVRAATVAVLAGLVVLTWWLPNRPRPAGPDLDGRFDSLSFAPYRAGEAPRAGHFPTAAEAASDMALLAPHTRAVRSYAAIGGDYDAAALARARGLRLWQGIWLGADRAQNEREIASGIVAARAWPGTVDRVVVGNEVLLRRDLPPAELIAVLDRVRNAVSQPVTYADVPEFWRLFPEVAAHVDLITVHLLPYWEDDPVGIDAATARVGEELAEMRALFPGRIVAIGETGWPSRGRARGPAVPGVVNEARFLRGVVALARENGVEANLIEAFDQVWKYRDEGTAGANWGLWDADRRPKFPVRGKVTEDPAWPAHAAVSLACFGLLLGVSRARMPGAAFAPAAGLAALLGLALGWAQAATAPELYDTTLRVAAVADLAAQAALAVLLVAAVTRRGRARTGADATGAVQRLLRGRLPRLGPADWMDDLCFLFAWAAALLQLLLVVDPRYREFPLPRFAVPLVAVAARAVRRDLPRGGGGREEAWAGATLAFGAVAGAVREGAENRQAMAWTLAALVLAVPLLLRLLPGPSTPLPNRSG